MEGWMSSKRYKVEQIIGILRRAEVLVGQGKEMAASLQPYPAAQRTVLQISRSDGLAD